MHMNDNDEEVVNILLIENRPALRDNLIHQLEQRPIRNVRFKVIAPTIFVEEIEGGTFEDEKTATLAVFEILRKERLGVVVVDLGLPPLPDDPDVGTRLILRILDDVGLGTSFKIAAYSNQAKLHPSVVARFVRKQVSYLAVPTGTVDMSQFPLALWMIFKGYFMFSPYSAPLLKDILNVPPDPLETGEWELLYVIAKHPQWSYPRIQEKLGLTGENVVGLKAHAIMDKLEKAGQQLRLRGRDALAEWWRENYYKFAREDTKPKGL